VITLSAGINSLNPDDYVYVDAGIAVERTAIGASAAVYKGLVLQDLSKDYGLSLINTTQCVPVMQSNPIQCQPGGNVTVVSDHNLTVISADGDCLYHAYYPSRNLALDSAMVNSMCVTGFNSNSNKTESIGLATIVFGAFTDPEGKTPFASHLARALNDENKTVGLAGGSTYAVTCTVNPRNSFDYRMVTLDLQAIERKNGSKYAYYLSGGEPCTPVQETISNTLFVTAAVANHNLVRENFGLSGYFSTVRSIAGFDRGPPYAFANSRNALEDSLGLVAALAVSSLQISGANVSANALEDHGGSAYAVVEATRLGTDKLEALLLLIPPVGSFVILAYLVAKSFRDDRGPRGREHGNMLKDKRPRRYAAESVYELMLLGSLHSRDGQDSRSSTPGMDIKGEQASVREIGDLDSSSSEQLLPADAYSENTTDLGTVGIPALDFQVEFSWETAVGT
jgi:hypothetical protein